MRNAVKKSLLCALLMVLIAPLTACSASKDTQWKLVAQGEIVALDSVNLVFVRGGRYTINSKSVIDYQYAYRTKDGGYRQRMVSDVWSEVTRSDSYPGPSVVTVYPDAGGDVKPSIQVYRCSTPETFAACALPDGTKIEGVYRVDFHVPPGTFVEEK